FALNVQIELEHRAPINTSNSDSSHSSGWKFPTRAKCFGWRLDDDPSLRRTCVHAQNQSNCKRRFLMQPSAFDPKSVERGDKVMLKKHLSYSSGRILALEDEDLVRVQYILISGGGSKLET